MNMFPDGALIEPEWYHRYEHKAECDTIRQAIRDAGYGAEILLYALEAETGPGGALYDEQHRYMNPGLALGMAHLMARHPNQMKSAVRMATPKDEFIALTAEPATTKSYEEQFALKSRYLKEQRDAAESELAELKAWANRMPDAGITVDDPRLQWWYDRPCADEPTKP